MNTHIESSVTKSLVQKILENPLGHEWSVQGLGMMRLYLDDCRRLHIWDKQLKIKDVSEMHTHPWNFRSTVVAGMVHNQRYEITEKEDEEDDWAVEYNQQTIFCGVGGGLVGEPSKTFLRSKNPETYVERETYHELAHEIHVSHPKDGTVTIVKREFLSDADHALVFWKDGDWVSAEPRAATPEEIVAITQNSLKTWFNWP